PTDLGILRVEVKPRQVIPANDRVEIDATVQAVGAAYEAQIVCRLDGQAAAERKPVKLEAGQSQTVAFERTGLAEGWHQAEIVLEGADHEVPFDNARFLTFRVQGPRRVLVITDHRQDAGFLTTALSAGGAYDCTVKETPEMKALYPEELRKTYPAIFLLSVADPERELWEKLENYVQNGGGLAVLPGGEELDRTAYNDNPAAQALLPGGLVKVVERPQGVDWNWNQNNYQHPLLRPFQKWRQAGDVDFVRFPRRTFRYWAVQRYPDQDHTSVVVSYEDKGEDQQPAPAILERQLTQKDRRGRVLLFTTTLDRRSGWNNYIESITSFYLVLAQLTAGYLSGDAEDGNFNYPCGQTVPVVLPDQVLYPTYTLQGPGLSAVDAVVTRPNNEKELLLSQAVLPGNFSLFGGPEARTVADFSLNVPGEESQLARVPPEQIDALLGPNSVLSLDRKISLKEALQQHWSQPVELLPALLILLLLVLAVENLLANKFYKPAVSDQPAAMGGVTSKEF
ncbi:MAG: hypothetical protein JO112_14530, partial [Planctomycetes bacterium]|nr:hypothetical protein [Planctomycetota bacterium]